jgi:hypothetical protein
MYDKNIAFLDKPELEPAIAMNWAYSTPASDHPAMPPAQPAIMPVQIIRIWTPLRMAVSLLEFVRSPLKSIRNIVQSPAEP